MHSHSFLKGQRVHSTLPGPAEPQGTTLLKSLTPALCTRVQKGYLRIREEVRFVYGEQLGKPYRLAQRKVFLY
jgi:hypothetical protein